jgi:hypothetical protein
VFSPTWRFECLSFESGQSQAKLCDQPHQLINRQCKDAEHQVAEHLGVTAHPHIARTEIILDAAIDPLGGAALVVAQILGEDVAGLARWARASAAIASLPPGTLRGCRSMIGT